MACEAYRQSTENLKSYIYADEGISGVSINKREQFKKMIKDCEDGRIEIKLA